MSKLEDMGQKVGFPSTYLFYTNTNADQVTKFVKNFRYGDRLHCCTQNTKAVLNLNGAVCLKTQNSGDLVEMPSGTGDFYHASIKGMGIL